MAKMSDYDRGVAVGIGLACSIIQSTGDHPRARQRGGAEVTETVETRTIRDPFLNQDVEISDRLVDRLRGRYAVGPTGADGEPEFGWQQHPQIPIQVEAADAIETLDGALADVCDELGCARDNEVALEAAQDLKARTEAAESALREALDVMRPFAMHISVLECNTIHEISDDQEWLPENNTLVSAKEMAAARAFIEKHRPAATSEDK